MTYTVLAERGITTAPSWISVVVGRAATNQGGTVLAVPASQLCYWTRAWQAEEQRATAELARGEGRQFANGTEAVRWLLSDADWPLMTSTEGQSHHHDQSRVDLDVPDSVGQ